MNKTTLRKFFARQGINKKGFCKEAGITPQMVNLIINGDQPITQKTKDKLIHKMKEYGYETT